MDSTVWFSLLLGAPLIGFVINGLRANRATPNLAGGVATAASALSFVAAIFLFIELLGATGDAPVLKAHFFEWIHVGGLKLNAAFAVDAISAVMILIITGVGTLIHLFSIGYMSHEPGVSKYFAYLNLFLFNMLILVLGDSLPVMFVGWEGVGLCSYLLIGFWYKDRLKAAAGMKAFIVNRIGDAAFLIGMFILFMEFNTLNFAELNAAVGTQVSQFWLDPLTLGTLFLFIGATGKSAQIPLYVWLPDAMAGPTPVSALIHAATMVTAGVYMIVRLNAVFLATPLTMEVIAIIGAATALGAAIIGMTQFDIKKVLAYSTVSQLGYMFLACGVGAFGAAMFHLMTHAFFKALMFLGSGSVIHGMHEEQDVRKMGGLKKYMPITHATFFIGWIAIIGLPPFAGFFSKDEILWLSYHSPFGHPLYWVVGAVAALMTSFYMTRLMALTFWGQSRVDKSVHPHESGWIMWVPLAVLAVLSAVGGWIGIPHVIGAILPGHPENIFANWLKPVVLPIPGITEPDVQMEWLLMGASVLGAAISAAIAYHFYVRSPATPERIATKLGGVYRFVYNKYFVDELYDKAFVRPLVRGSERLWYYFDVRVIDRTTVLLADLMRGSGQFVRTLQNGNIQQYALYVSLGIVVGLYLLMVR